MFACYFNRSPALLGLDDIRSYQLHLVHARKVTWGSFNQAVCALRFLYLKTLGKDWNIEHIPFAKQPKKLPLVLSQDEVHAVLDAITNPQNRVIAITLYAAGLRVSEAVSLRVEDIDSQRMLLHVVQGRQSGGGGAAGGGEWGFSRRRRGCWWRWWRYCGRRCFPATSGWCR